MKPGEFVNCTETILVQNVANTTLIINLSCIINTGLISKCTLLIRYDHRTGIFLSLFWRGGASLTVIIWFLTSIFDTDAVDLLLYHANRFSIVPYVLPSPCYNRSNASMKISLGGRGLDVVRFTIEAVGEDLETSGSINDWEFFWQDERLSASQDVHCATSYLLVSEEIPKKILKRS